MLDEWIRNHNENGKKVFTENWNNKRRNIFLVGMICIGIIALLWPSQPISAPQAVPERNLPSDSVDLAKAQLADELESILSQIDGAGKVQVSITLSSDGKKQYASKTVDEKRDTKETDRNGGERNIKEENLSTDLAVSGGQAILIESQAPEVLGVLVVAEGARDVIIKEKLNDATATLLNISPHQVRVLPRKEG